MAQAVVMPSFGMYTTEGTLVNWLKAEGASVAAGEAIAEVETLKAINEIIASADGLLQQVAPLGSMVKEEGVIAFILAPGEALQVVEAAPEAAAPAQAEVPAPVVAAVVPVTTAGDAQDDSGFIRATPLARALARQHGIDLAAVAPTGPNRRIVGDDVSRVLLSRGEA